MTEFNKNYSWWDADKNKALTYQEYLDSKGVDSFDDLKPEDKKVANHLADENEVIEPKKSVEERIAEMNRKADEYRTGYTDSAVEKGKAREWAVDGESLEGVIGKTTSSTESTSGRAGGLGLSNSGRVNPGVYETVGSSTPPSTLDVMERSRQAMDNFNPDAHNLTNLTSEDNTPTASTVLNSPSAAAREALNLRGGFGGTPTTPPLSPDDLRRTVLMHIATAPTTPVETPVTLPVDPYANYNRYLG